MSRSLIPPTMGKKNGVDNGEEERKETRREEKSGGHVLSLLIGLSKAPLGGTLKHDAATGCI